MTRAAAEAVQFEEDCSVSLEVDVEPKRTPVAHDAKTQGLPEMSSRARSPVWAVLSALALFVLLTATGYLAFTYLVAG